MRQLGHWRVQWGFKVNRDSLYRTNVYLVSGEKSTQLEAMSADNSTAYLTLGNVTKAVLDYTTKTVEFFDPAQMNP